MKQIIVHKNSLIKMSVQLKNVLVSLYFFLLLRVERIYHLRQLKMQGIVRVTGQLLVPVPQIKKFWEIF